MSPTRDNVSILYYSPYSTENCVCVGYPTQMKSTQEISNVHAQRKDPTPGTQRNLYSTGLRLGFASGITQLLGFASGETRKMCFTQRKIYQHVFIFCPTPTPDARYFAFWWNKGLCVRQKRESVAFCLLFARVLPTNFTKTQTQRTV